MRLSHILVLLFLILCSGLFAKNSNKLLEVQIKLVKKFIIFQAKIEASKPLNFIFDSAAGPSVIDSTSSDQMDLNFSRSVSVGTAGRSLHVANSDQYQLSLGALAIPLDLVVMDLGHLSKYLGLRIDGIIGVDLLKSYIVEAEIDAGRINLYAFGTYANDGTGMLVKLIKLPSSHLGLECFASFQKNIERPLVLKIDTAYPDYLILSPRGINGLGVNDRYLKKRKKVGGFGADDTITTNLRGRIRYLKISAWIWKSVPSIFTVDPLSVNASRSNETDGIIGQEILLDFNVVYDWKHNVAYFTKRNNVR